MKDDEYKWHDIHFDDEEEGEITKEDLEREVQFKRDAEYIDSNLWSKLQEVGKRISFAKDIKALYAYMTDNSVSWYRKAIVAGALVYFIVPLDAVPDLAPLFGYMDDLGVITAVMKYLGSELTSYY